MSLTLNKEQVGVIDVRPITPVIGAEITGVRLGANLDSRQLGDIHAALLRHKVIFFRGQHHLDEAEQEAFGRRFGELVPHPTIPSLEGTQNVLDLDGAKGNRASAWHTDVTFVDAYPKLSILRGVVIPPVGGDHRLGEYRQRLRGPAGAAARAREQALGVAHQRL